MKDLDVIKELSGVAAMYKKKSNRNLAEEIDKILASEFEPTNESYAKAIKRMKTLINGITNQCGTKYTKRVLIVLEVLNGLEIF
jgi:oligoribonuclease NrnB/cAMP/cGMP phosphodiesterase (DHH superfamily)